MRRIVETLRKGEKEEPLAAPDTFMRDIVNGLRKSEQQLQREEVSSIPAEAPSKAREKVHSDLGQVAVVRAHIRPESRLVVYSEPRSVGAERYRVLRARLGEQQAAKKIKTLLITSALPQEGKSVTALNLASVLARQERRNVLLVEGDLRRAILRQHLGLAAGPGLDECLLKAVNPLSAMRRVDPLGFYLLAAGRPVTNPVELLQLKRFGEVLQNLHSLFDWILVDSPPVSLFADTPVLKAHVDATLLVVRAGMTPHEAIVETVQLLGPEHIVGVVFNGAQAVERTYYHYYQQYYQYGAENGRRK